MVLSYSYLWHREQTKGETEGRKDRPSAVVLVLNRTGFGDVVYVLPTTTSEPKADDPSLEIPRSIKYRLKLDESRSWINVTELNVFAAFEPKIPDAYRDSEFLFLANIDPVLQRRVREAMPGVKLVAGDTMNYWIKDHRPALLEVLKGLDVLLINDTEARMLAGNNNLVQAARGVMALGPRALVVKHGEYGATLFYNSPSKNRGEELRTFKAPALPLKEVVDPTGAGDSFAGGFFGYLASQPELTPAAWRHAMFYGSVMGSYACERFGTERLQQLSRSEIDTRFNVFREITHLD